MVQTPKEAMVLGGPQRSVQRFVRYCLQCQTMNVQTPNYVQLHPVILRPQWILF